MTKEEFKQRDRKLVDQYNEYLADCAEHEIQIGINHREMAKIEMNREDLLIRYQDGLQ